MPKAIEHDDVTIIDGDSYGYEESDQSKAFEDFRAAFKDEEMGTLRVHRVPVTNKTTNAAKLRTVYLFSCPIDAFGFEDLLEHIRDQYGGGTYRLIGSREGHRGHAFNKIVEIEAPKPRFNATNVDGQGGAHGSNAAELVNNLGAVLLEHSSRVEEMMRGSAAPMGDPLDQMTKLMAAMGTAISTMGFKQPEQRSIVDQLTEFAAIKDLFDSGDSGDSGESNIYSLLTETVKNFGPLLGAAIATQTKAGVIPMTGPVPALISNPTPPPGAPPGAPPLSKELEDMRPQISFLVGQAKLGAAPGDVAAAIMPAIPETGLESIEAFLQKPDYLELCVSVNAEVTQHREWFQKWREAMLFDLSQILVDVPSPIDDADSLQPGEIIGGEPLTLQPADAQTAPAVVGAMESDIRADASDPTDESDSNGSAGGSAGDTRDP